MVQTYEPAITNWPLSSLYVAIHLLSVNLFSILIWGFINRLTSFAEGIKYYIILAFVLGIPSAVLVPALGFFENVIVGGRIL
jgi:ATP/ADP translocase